MEAGLIGSNPGQRDGRWWRRACRRLMSQTQGRGRRTSGMFRLACFSGVLVWKPVDNTGNEATRCSRGAKRKKKKKGKAKKESALRLAPGGVLPASRESSNVINPLRWTARCGLVAMLLLLLMVTMMNADDAAPFPTEILPPSLPNFFTAEKGAATGQDSPLGR
ncbi:hypothetical protein CISG_02961 [Coccidioides immitis RMSCC 3703]|uniref:Uncharacterized protein n=2 Tax=Coccidioides immitis TaxID=5501 RepID=A0A0J8TFA8_COCIT|nr:hypothetical protein CIRG_08114 [Coccidioides immitis RMSCC 2394]KMU72312.1 hypothetical protein CISG_02961 [Coccidioides immitis RMSCC 3703]